MYVPHLLFQLAITDSRCSSVPVLGIPVLHTRLGLHWGNGTGVFVFPISQLASFVTWEIEGTLASFHRGLFAYVYHGKGWMYN